MSTHALTLVPIEPDNGTHMAELARQRQLCCWGLNYIPVWRKLMRVGDKCLYWIVPTDPSLYPIPTDEPYNLKPGYGPPPPDPSFQPIGHVALDREDYHDPPNKLLASRETGAVMMASLFILKSQQGRGLGNAILRMMEDEARRLGAPEITLDTMQAKDAIRPEYWASVGASSMYNPKGRINQYWYEKQGYVVFQEDMPRYKEKNDRGEEFMIHAVSMRKVLKPVEG